MTEPVNLAIRIKLPWWTKLYMGGLLLGARLGATIDPRLASERIGRHMKVCVA